MRECKRQTKDLYLNKRRWILTAVLAALAHDIGKVFTDMEITAPNGQHWVQDEPIVDWLRKNGIKSYYISFRPGREHNAHKSASLANNGMLIPKETFTFLGLTGYGEQMLKEFRNALLEGKEGGLIGKILDNADGLSSMFITLVKGLSAHVIAPRPICCQRKLFKSTLNNRLHRNLACVIDKSSRGAKL